MVGFTRLLGIEMSAKELQRRFLGRELVHEEPVPGVEKRRYVRGPAPIRQVVGRGWFDARRFELRRT
jgi:hypothetical protein